MESVNKKYYPVIDIAKGIGIILVVVGHAVPDANTGIQNFFWGGGISMDILLPYGIVYDNVRSFVLP